MLNDSKIKKLKSQDKIYRVADQGGLCIEIRPTGKKLWRIRYRYNNKASMLSLGEYPIIGLAEAREQLFEIKNLLLKNINPAIHRIDLKKQNQQLRPNTFATLAEEFRHERLLNKSQRYQNQFIQSLHKDILPIIGHKNIKDVNSADVLSIIKNTIQRIRSQSNYGSGEVTAIQNRKFIGAVMRYAIATLRADHDPTYAVRDVVQRPNINHARALSKNDLYQVRTQLENYGGTLTVKHAGLMLLYSMLRTIEIRRLEWNWVDFEQKIIIFPKEAMKKNRVHILPLSTQLLLLLREQHKISGHHTYVFSSTLSPHQMLNQMTLNRMLQHINLAHISAHDFRATASTLLYEAGYDEKWIEMQLAHADLNKTRSSYNHAQYLKQRHLMMQDWANIVDQWLIQHSKLQKSHN